MSDDAVPEWLYPPHGREWTVDDLANLPDEAPEKLEIIDGALILMSPQRYFHMAAITAIEVGLRAQVPDKYMVGREWTVALPNGDAPLPDVLVFDEGGFEGEDQTYMAVEHVVLAVEVVSPSSRKRDQLRKPRLYADAGIEHYWIVDRQDGTTIITTYDRNPAGGAYQPGSEYRDHITRTQPFPIDIDLSSKALGL